MDIDKLTIGQAKELASMFGNSANQSNNITDSLIGEYVIVRSRNEGVNAGIIERADDTGVVLKEARRIWYHKPKNKDMAWYEGVAVSGLSDDSKISETVETKVIIEDYSITVCSDIASKSIKEHKTYGQN